MNRCPICHARLQCDNDNCVSLKCCRCGSELHHLFELEQQARFWLQLALLQFISHNKSEALSCLRQALSVQATPFAHCLYAFVESQRLAASTASYLGV